jgi:hypothetical protein
MSLSPSNTLHFDAQVDPQFDVIATTGAAAGGHTPSAGTAGPGPRRVPLAKDGMDSVQVVSV